MAEAVKILIIEDDLHTRDILSKIISRDPGLRTYRPLVLLAADGAEGVDLFKQQLPQLVITDLLLPKLDGFKVVEAIREHPRGKDVPILVTSAVYRDHSTIHRLQQSGSVYFQPKPFSARVLLARVQEILAARHPAADKIVDNAAGKGAAAPAPLVSQPTAEVLDAVLGEEARELAEGSRQVSQRQESAAAPEPSAKPAPLPAGAASSSAETGARPPEAAAFPPPAQPSARSAGSAAPLFSGALADHPLGEVLLDVFDMQQFGLLDLRQGKVHKRLFIMAGHPIYVQSNLRSETLGQLLVRRGGLTAAQHSETLKLAEARGIKYGEALVQTGLMSEGQVMQELLAQTRLKVETCLRWTEGTFSFTEDPAVGTRVPHCVLDPVLLVLEGLKRFPDLDASFRKLAERGNHAILPTARLEALRERFCALFGQSVLAALRPGQTITQLLSQVGSPQEVILQLDNMLQVGMVLLEAQTTRVQTLPPAGDRSLTLEQLAQPAADEELVPQPLPEEPAPQELLLEDSEVIHLAQQPAARLRAARSKPAQVKVALQLIQSTYLGLHDSTHYQVLGLSLQSDASSIEVAYQIKRKQFDLSNFRDMDLGEHYAHIEEIGAALDEAFTVLSDPARREAYNQALSLGGQLLARSQRTKALQAEELYRRGEELIEQGAFAKAAQLLDAAIRLDPQADYYALQALATFQAQPGAPPAADRALEQLELALELDAASTLAYWVMARILRSLGQQDQALRALRQVIKLDPSHQQAFDELEQLLRDRAAIEALEAEYRRTIHLASQQDPHWTGRLWLRLARLYRDELHDAARARLACETALRLLPHDQEIRRLLTSLDCQDPGRWRDALLGYRSLLRANPSEPEPLHQLFQLHRQAGRTDAACTAAGAVVALGWATVEEQQFYATQRRQVLQRVAGPLEPALWQLLRHPDDDPGLGALFEALTPLLHALHPLRAQDLGLTAGNRLEPSALPQPFAELLAYVARLLGSPLPSVVLDERLAAEIQLIGCSPPALLVGAAALRAQDPLPLCFRLGQAVSMIKPERAVASWYPRQVLRGAIYAALAQTFPALDLPDPSGEASALRQQLASRPRLAKTVVEIMISLQQRLDRLNLSSWQRGIQLTGHRLGLLLCGELPVACQVLAEQDPDSQRALIDFALSKTYGELRDRLALALPSAPSLQGQRS